MVDVGGKADTTRVAIAKGVVTMQPETLQLIQQGALKKGDVLSVARVAGIMAAKRTHDLIPLCHPLPITSVTVDLTPNVETSSIDITATVKVTGKTGVEMEALTAVSVAGLTVYDMAKAVDKDMVIGEIKLLHKEGGKSGTYVRDDAAVEKPKPALRSRNTRNLRAVPKEVMGVAGMQKPNIPHTQHRDAFKAFVTHNKIRIMGWTKKAGVPSGEVFSYLNGQSTRLSPESAQKLAAAMNVTVAQMFGE